METIYVLKNNRKWFGKGVRCIENNGIDERKSLLCKSEIEKSSWRREERREEA